jgi:hypothetical protein
MKNIDNKSTVGINLQKVEDLEAFRGPHCSGQAIHKMHSGYCQASHSYIGTELGNPWEAVLHRLKKLGPQDKVEIHPG